MIRSAAAFLTFAALVACASSATSDPGRARQWITTNARAVRVMYGDAANLELVLNGPERHTYAPALLSACGEVEGRLPTPDEHLSHDLRLALTEYALGAQRAAGDQVTIAATDLRAGDRAFASAKKRAQDLGSSFYAH